MGRYSKVLADVESTLALEAFDINAIRNSTDLIVGNASVPQRIFDPGTYRSDKISPGKGRYTILAFKPGSSLRPRPRCGIT